MWASDDDHIETVQEHRIARGRTAELANSVRSDHSMQTPYDGSALTCNCANASEED